MQTNNIKYSSEKLYLKISVQKKAGISPTATISMAIFPKDNGSQAAAAVVGFQMPISSLHRRIVQILSKNVTNELDCKSISTDCYLIDHNGYIIISEAHKQDTGKFFGELDYTAPVMTSLIRQGLFRPIEMYDYLSVCYDYVSINDIAINIIFSYDLKSFKTAQM